MKELKYLNKYFLKYKYRVLLGIFIVACAKIFSLFTPQLIGDVVTLVADQIDRPIPEASFKASIRTKIFLILGAALATGVFTFLMRQTLINVSRYIEFDLKNEIYKHYQSLCLPFYKQNRTGDLMNRITEDVSKVRMYVGPALMYTINTLTLFLVAVIYMYSKAPSLTLYTILPLPLLSVSIYYLSKFIHKRSTIVQVQLSNLSSATQEIFSGISITKAYAIEAQTQKEFAKLSNSAWQWHPINCAKEDMVPQVDGSDQKVLPMMTTADMSMKIDPAYNKICKYFLENPEAFGEAFAKAWFKLLHRDMGPKTNYIAGDFKDVDYTWQDPVVQTPELSSDKIAEVKTAITNSGLTQLALIETAWASASTFRQSDNRGGANGARIRLEPQKNWAVNKPEQLRKVLDSLEKIAIDLGISIADTIVIGGAVGIEMAGGNEVEVTTGRGDATQENTSIDSFELLKPKACGFRNYAEKEFSVTPEEIMLDKAQLLELSTVEMTVLVGGLRSMGVSHNSKGLWTNGKLDNSWFKTLLSMDVKWKKTGFNSYVGIDRNSQQPIRTASRTDLVFGSNSELRAIVEVYATDENNDKFINDFIAVWNKVMNADRFDLN